MADRILESKSGRYPTLLTKEGDKVAHAGRVWDAIGDVSITSTGSGLLEISRRELHPSGILVIVASLLVPEGYGASIETEVVETLHEDTE